MRISVEENKILNAVMATYPLKSSIAKIVSETRLSKNKVIDVVEELKKVGYVNRTSSNEVYLKSDGRNYLGITSTCNKENADMRDANEQHPVLASIDKIANKLNKPAIKIADCDLKTQALSKLAEIMSDDIAKLLLEIKCDLERVRA